MKLTLQILRVFAGLLFLAAGLFHFDNYQTMAVYVPLPVGSKYFVLLVATLITGCALGIILDKFTRHAFFALAIIFSFTGLMILIPTIHFSNDYYTKMIQIPNLYKTVIGVIIFILLIAIPKKG